MDSSAYAKLFIQERGSLELVAVLAELDAGEQVTSSIARLEVRSALERKFRMAEISQDQRQVALGDLAISLAHMLQMEISFETIIAAEQLVGLLALKSLDALQLSCAVALRQQLAVTDTMVFVSSDVRLLAAASAEGFVIWNPAETLAPPTLPVN